MLESERLIKDILLGFANYGSYVESCGKIGTQDTNKMAEGFVAELLNELLGLELEVVEPVNFPGIDLLDRKLKIGVQVSSDATASKINNTLIVIATSKIVVPINRLFFFFLKPKKKKYKVELSLLGVDFDAGQGVMDFNYIIRKLNVSSLEILRECASVVKKHLPHLYQNKIAWLEQSRKELMGSLTFLDRAVFSQLERYEDPFLMLVAIRDVRINLQKSGSKLVSNSVASEEFRKICITLQNCENRVREDFPILWDCVGRSCPPTPDENVKGELWKSLSIMMDIRTSINASADRITGELHKVNKALSK